MNQHIPIINVQNPVKTQINDERQADFVWIRCQNDFVKRTQDGHHIRDIDDFVVLRPKAVSVERVYGRAQLQFIDWQT